MSFITSIAFGTPGLLVIGFSEYTHQPMRAIALVTGSFLTSTLFYSVTKWAFETHERVQELEKAVWLMEYRGQENRGTLPTLRNLPKVQ